MQRSVNLQGDAEMTTRNTLRKIVAAPGVLLRAFFSGDPITRRDLYVVLGVVLAVVMARELFPRYEWRERPGRAYIRIDRWTGHAVLGSFGRDGAWAPPVTIVRRIN